MRYTVTYIYINIRELTYTCIMIINKTKFDNINNSADRLPNNKKKVFTFLSFTYNLLSKSLFLRIKDIIKNNKRMEFKKKKDITQLKFVHPKQTKHKKK